VTDSVGSGSELPAGSAGAKAERGADGTDASLSAARRGQAPQPHRGAPQAPGLRAACRRGTLEQTPSVTASADTVRQVEYRVLHMISALLRGGASPVATPQPRPSQAWVIVRRRSHGAGLKGTRNALAMSSGRSRAWLGQGLLVSPAFDMISTRPEVVIGVDGKSGQPRPHMGRLPVNGLIIVRSHNLRLQCPNGVQVEPVSVLAVPNQNNLTFGRRTRQPHHDPASGGRGSGGRDHSYVRLLKP
jgi:hypothetical protein